MNPNRGNEGQDHRDAKPTTGHLFDTTNWTVFYEQRDADMVVMHNATGFTPAIEFENSARNCTRNITRNLINGCHAVAVVVLNQRYFNQITNKIQKHIHPDDHCRIRVFHNTDIGLLNLRTWLIELSALKAKREEGTR